MPCRRSSRWWSWWRCRRQVARSAVWAQRWSTPASVSWAERGHGRSDTSIWDAKWVRVSAWGCLPVCLPHLITQPNNSSKTRPTRAYEHTFGMDSARAELHIKTTIRTIRHCLVFRCIKSFCLVAAIVKQGRWIQQLILLWTLSTSTYFPYPPFYTLSFVMPLN